MAVQTYQTESGERHFSVRVTQKSKTNRALRVQRQKSGFKTAQEARAAEKRLREEAQRELWERENLGASWGHLVDQFELALREGRGSERPIGVATAEDYVAALHRYTSSWWNRPASEITRVDVRRVIEELAQQGKSNSRKRAVKNAVCRAFEWGIENELIQGMHQSPTFGIKIGREEDRKPEILTLNEIKKLLELSHAHNHPWYQIWSFALLTGMRSGELHAMLWTDIDWESRRLTVAKSYNGRLKQVTSTKARYWREVPISPELEMLLKELRDTSNGRTHVLPRFMRWDRGEQARILREFCEGIGIPSVKFHALRVCFATQLLRDKIAPAVVMKVCGWKDLKTMQRYIRLAGIEIEGATDGLKFLPPREVMGRVVELFRPLT